MSRICRGPATGSSAERRTAPRSGLRSDQGIAPYAVTVSLRTGDRPTWCGNPQLSFGKLPPSSSLRETLDDTPKTLREGGKTHLCPELCLLGAGGSFVGFTMMCDSR